jgi:hypothetical protein
MNAPRRLAKIRALPARERSWMKVKNRAFGANGEEVASRCAEGRSVADHRFLGSAEGSYVLI